MMLKAFKWSSQQEADRHGVGAVALHPDHRQQTGSLDLAWPFETLKPVPSDTPYNPSQTVPLSGDQAFTYVSLCRPSSFRSQLVCSDLVLLKHWKGLS